MNKHVFIFSLLIGLTITNLISAQTLFNDNFNDGNAQGWFPTSETWAVHSFEYSGDSPSASGWTHSETGDSLWDNYVLALKWKLISDEGYLAIRFKYNDEDNYYQFMFRKNSLLDADVLRLERKVSGIYYEVGSNNLMTGGNRSLTDVPMTINADQWYAIKIVLNGLSIKVYVDGDLKYDVEDETFSNGKISLAVHSYGSNYTIPTHAHFDNIKVTSLSVTASLDDDDDSNDGGENDDDDNDEDSENDDDDNHEGGENDDGNDDDDNDSNDEDDDKDGDSQQKWEFHWSGNSIIPDHEFYDHTKWTLNPADFNQGDRIAITTANLNFQINWTLGSGNRSKWVQSYIRLSEPLSLKNSDIIGLDFKGADIKKIDGSDVEGEVGFELKFEDGSTQAVFRWDNLARLQRWANKISLLKKQFYNAAALDWSNINIISLAIYGPPSQNDISGTATIRNLISSDTSKWKKATTQGFIRGSKYQRIKYNAVNALINRQKATGLLTTWVIDDTSWLYGQGLALKALTIEGKWHARRKIKRSAMAAEKLALFLANNQENEGYWPRTWIASTGEVINRVENNNTIWMGDFPWPLIGLQSYYKKTGDQRVRLAIENALRFIKSLINENGQLFTLNVRTNEQQPVTSSEAYATVLLSLYESNEIQLADTMWNYILSNNWDNDLNLWKEGINGHRLVLFANTWLAPFLVNKGQSQMALDSLSLVGKALYTNGPGAPYGLDGIVPLAVWYEGTLSYISAGSPASDELFDNLKNFINEDGTVPHYNSNIGSMGGIWAVDWASLDGTSWLYFAASGNSPFDVLSGTPVMID